MGDGGWWFVVVVVVGVGVVVGWRWFRDDKFDICGWGGGGLGMRYLFNVDREWGILCV